MRPRVRRAKRAEAQINVNIGEGSWSPQGSGSSRAISRSKRRNRIATRKNRKEKGRRAEPNGSNPHSYGESFWWSGVISGSQNETAARMRERAVVIRRTVNRRFIIFPWSLTKTG